jgi:PD-(D/E)XK nuclease superfamily
MTMSDESDDEKLRALRTLVVDCPELRELERRLGPFNIFDVLKSAHNEIRHSNVLAWLLDPKGSHGMRDKAFVNPNAPLDWRERLCALAEYFPNTTHKNNAPDGKFTFYRVRGAEIKLGEAESSEIGDLADVMWAWVQTALSSESFGEMVTVVAEHLKAVPKSTEVCVQ